MPASLRGRRGVLAAELARGKSGTAGREDGATARRIAQASGDFVRTVPRKRAEVAARGIRRARTAPSRRAPGAPGRIRPRTHRVFFFRVCLTHHSRDDAPALRLDRSSFMFGSSARSFRHVLPPENIMLASAGATKRRRPDRARRAPFCTPKSDR
ncbi:predicted protein [Micromonas commoda]|uniref:Uncharacterized protein n=1 Tax=Micromonas commoda (strain RCC299 / NOUM17 / CCMP2709) TaxID=296587 RepID=C1EEX4_MICCC|nr:predicted protein [Micromonas commoda]ACO66315.1 predicted protein [Micromonas commoda]|eukprot:XP_002505057.1 predicted protein [Micromonas commoda]